MKLNCFYSDAIEEVNDEIKAMLEKGQNVDQPLEDIGETLWLAVRRSLPRSKEHHVHMQDDILNSVKTNAKGQKYVSVRGGKETGYKWHIINDGHLTNGFSKGKLRKRNGQKTEKGAKATFVPGTHFIDKAVNSASGHIEIIIDEYIGDIVE